MIQIIPVTGLPEIRAGDALAELLVAHLHLLPGDVLVVTQKIVSKAEDRIVDLANVSPSPEAIALAAELNKDAALVELVLRDSSSVVRKAPNVLIARHRLGHVMANAGIDASNIGAENGGKVLFVGTKRAARDAVRALLHQEHRNAARTLGVQVGLGRDHVETRVHAVGATTTGPASLLRLLPGG